MMNSNYQMDIKLANQRIQAHRREAELLRLARQDENPPKKSGFRQLFVSIKANFKLSYRLKKTLGFSKKQAA